MKRSNPVFEKFLSEHRWAVLTTLRKTGNPVSSVVAYAIEGNDFIVSTPGATFKRSSIERDERVNLCAISNSEPFNFVAVEGLARVQTENLEPATRLVFAAIADTNFSLPDPLDAWLEAQQRVILRITPTRISGVIR